MSERHRYEDLVETFPVMRDAPRAEGGAWSLDLAALDAWAMQVDPDGSDGVKATVAFLLNLWSTREPWRVGKFDLFAALLVWDSEQIAAWQAWAAAPWRP